MLLYRYRKDKGRELRRKEKFSRKNLYSEIFFVPLCLLETTLLTFHIFRNPHSIMTNLPASLCSYCLFKIIILFSTPKLTKPIYSIIQGGIFFGRI